MEREPFLCIAGKNNIAVNVLSYVIEHLHKRNVGIICNNTENGENSFQRSLRKYAIQKGIKEYRLEEVYQIANLIFLSLEFDQIIHPEFFSDARLYNIHFSLLPQYKGMYTSAHPILNGEEFSGVTLHLIDSGIDTGEIIDQEKFSIDNANCKELYLKYIDFGTRVVLRNIDNIISDTIIPKKQNKYKSSYYSRKSIDYKNIHIDLNQTAEGIIRQIRAFSFRDYQMPKILDKDIISARILESRSLMKPGNVIYECDEMAVISTIDYNLSLYYDRFDELMMACEVGNMDLVKDICIVRIHVNEQDKNGWSPLIKATYYNNIDIAKYLVGIGADIYVKNRNGTNLLMYAKEAYKRTGDNFLFKFFKKLGLSEKMENYEGKNLIYYLEHDNITLKELCE